MANINDTNYLISSAAGAVYNKKVREAQRKRNYELSSIAEEMAINQNQKEPKTMKATLLLRESDNHGNKWMAGDQTIDIKDSSTLTKEVFDWMLENNLSRDFLRNVFFDGMLLEYTYKPVLREVSTGIEL